MYQLAKNHNLRETIGDALTRKQRLEEQDVIGGTTHGAHEKNIDDKLEGRRMAGGIFEGKGQTGEFATMANDPKNRDYIDDYMARFINGGFNDDLFPPPPPMPSSPPPEATA